jgi:hypothetical protein
VTLFVAYLGTSLLLVDAADEDHCRRAIGRRLGHENKPWLWRDIRLSPPTEAHLEALKVWKAPEIKDPAKGRDG